ncbi:hypothetical protein SAMN05444149_1099 [Pseudosulfitobacter pseudonitzschiae]|uniref:Uncharacterized protein n=1 Tax=Pseudosulfitobacter pseudonitzschiae TaxID=1402135 RepID=A0A073IWX4_9RHOB|nr:hypothetical protein SUH3_07795 [Pseudosulfitobacter pseudonitzschiae]SHG04732.1 hypothetical protein SAMN05444149_1099 [Pseudosulfitobacter pseudonitzschiae]
MPFLCQEQRPGMSFRKMRLICLYLCFGEGLRAWCTSREGCKITLIAGQSDHNCTFVVDGATMTFPPCCSFTALAHDFGIGKHAFAIGCQHTPSPPGTGMISRRTIGINHRDRRAPR